MLKPLYILPFLAFLFLLNACVHHRELVSFPSESTQFPAQDSIVNSLELRAQPDDLLRITVHSFNPEAVAPFNIEVPGQQSPQALQQVANAQGNYAMELFNGYLVDREGFISFPILGKVNVEGLTLTQIEKTITEGVKPYLKEAVVSARFFNFKVTVMGEVFKPGVVRLSNQRLSVLEAIGNAGDFTPYANRSNVLLIREGKGTRQYHRFNFLDEKLFDSPFYYLKQNDVLYVEPIKAKVATVQDPFARGVTYGSAFISIITLAVALFR